MNYESDVAHNTYPVQSHSELELLYEDAYLGEGQSGPLSINEEAHTWSDPLSFLGGLQLISLVHHQ